MPPFKRVYIILLICLCTKSQDSWENADVESEEIVSSTEITNNFRKCTFSTFFDKTNLKYNVSCQNTSYSAVYWLPPFVQVTHLNFNENNIEVFKSGPFKNLSSLEYLNLANNSIKTLKRSGFKKLKNLKYLVLTNNKIESVKLTVFYHCLGLVEIDFSYNEIIALHPFTSAMERLTDLKKLSFRHNPLKIIGESDFDDLSKISLMDLDLSDCALEKISSGAFTKLINLRHLKLSNNPIGSDENLVKALTNISSLIESVELSKISLYTVPTQSLQLLSKTNIQEIDLHGNVLSDFFKGSFPKFPSLRKLNLKNCDLTHLENDTFSNLTSLHELDISGNKLLTFFPAIYSLTTLKVLNMSDNRVYERFENFFDLGENLLVNMTSLTTLILDTLHIEKLKRRALYGLKNLKYLYIRDSSITNIDDFAFESLENLKLLDLSENKMDKLSKNLFIGMKNLSVLILSKNQLNMKDCRGHCLRHQSSSLQHLDLSHNKIEQFPQQEFSHLGNIKELILNNNLIIPWKEPMLFNEKINFKVLNLRSNNLNLITSAMLIDFNTLQQIDVSNNPFNCSSCEVHQFIKWINSRNIQLQNPQQMFCREPEDVLEQTLITLSVFPSYCTNEQPSNLPVIIPSVTLILILLIIIGLVYYFRWYLRYYWFTTCIKLRRANQENASGDKYNFDAFISYNVNDRQWVVKELLPNLEQSEPKLNLCLHERDFEIGKEIWSNIVESIDNSRKIVLLLSNNFLKSQWCTWEMNMAQFKLVDDSRNALVLVLLEKIDKKMASSTLKYLIRTRTYLEWSDNIQEQKLFWKRLKRALKNDEPDKTYSQQTLL